MNFKLSVIIPVFNEADTVSAVLEKVETIPYNKEIIVVDDGSTDSTKSVLERWRKKDANLKIVTNSTNKGKGFAVREGLKYVKGDVVIIQDADLEYNPEEYGVLIDHIINNKTDVVYGTRFDNKQSIFCHKSKLFHFLGNKLVTFIANLIYDGDLSDIMTCYKVFRSDLIKDLHLSCNGFAIEAEITSEILKKKVLIKEVPISYNPRTHKQGKKINFFTDFFRVVLLLILKRRTSA